MRDRLMQLCKFSAVTDVAVRLFREADISDAYAYQYPLGLLLMWRGVDAAPDAQGFSVEIKGRLAKPSGASAAFPSRAPRGERWW
jgi:hypothetical protein